MTVFGYQFYQQNQTAEEKKQILRITPAQPQAQIQQPHMGDSNQVQPVIYTNQPIGTNKLTKPLD
ncbi:hypothetical protein JKG47_23865, partial [Acidithiobacillus sp. MC6.1]|nr:hypothetical protein [Acidithiobacillus sp. MC6.1]